MASQDNYLKALKLARDCLYALNNSGTRSEIIKFQSFRGVSLMRIARTLNGFSDSYRSDYYKSANLIDFFDKCYTRNNEFSRLRTVVENQYIPRSRIRGQLGGDDRRELDFIDQAYANGKRSIINNGDRRLAEDTRSNTRDEVVDKLAELLGLEEEVAKMSDSPEKARKMSDIDRLRRSLEGIVPEAELNQLETRLRKRFSAKSELETSNDLQDLLKAEEETANMPPSPEREQKEAELAGRRDSLKNKLPPEKLNELEERIKADAAGAIKQSQDNLDQAEIDLINPYRKLNPYARYGLEAYQKYRQIEREQRRNSQPEDESLADSFIRKSIQDRAQSIFQRRITGRIESYARDRIGDYGFKAFRYAAGKFGLVETGASTAVATEGGAAVVAGTAAAEGAAAAAGGGAAVAAGGAAAAAGGTAAAGGAVVGGGIVAAVGGWLVVIIAIVFIVLFIIAYVFFKSTQDPYTPVAVPTESTIIAPGSNTIPPPGTSDSSIVNWALQIVNQLRIGPYVAPGSHTQGYDQMEGTISNGTYSAVNREGINGDTTPEGLYWCTNLVIDSYTLAGYPGLGGNLQGVINMLNFWQSTSGYKFYDYQRNDHKTILQLVQPGQVIFLAENRSSFTGSEHVAIVSEVVIDPSTGYGHITTLNSNSSNIVITFPVENWEIKNQFYPVVGFGGT